MAGIHQLSPVIVSAVAEAAAAFARPALRKSKNQLLEAVVPSRIVSASKPVVRLTLETIEEEDFVDSGLMDSPRTSSASSASSSSSSLSSSSSSSSSCFLESRRKLTLTCCSLEYS